MRRSGGENPDGRKFARVELRPEQRRRVEVRQRLPICVPRLNADVTGPSVEIGLDRLSDCPIAAAARRILVTKNRSAASCCDSWSKGNTPVVRWLPRAVIRGLTPP